MHIACNRKNLNLWLKIIIEELTLNQIICIRIDYRGSHVEASGLGGLGTILHI